MNRVQIPPFMEDFFRNNEVVINMVDSYVEGCRDLLNKVKRTVYDGFQMEYSADRYIEEEKVLHAVYRLKRQRYGREDIDITPPDDMLMSPFRLVSMDPYGLFRGSVKVVMIFQDPYPTPGIACGIPMMTLNGKAQPTLRNFHQRIQETVSGVPRLHNGDMRGLCTRGILMLNVAFTAYPGLSNFHTDMWKEYTSRLISWMSDRYPYLVFVLFGRGAGKMKDSIGQKHTVLETSHPSDLGKVYGFSTCNIFNLINKHLSRNMRDTIDWSDFTYV